MVEQRRWSIPITALCGFGTNGDSIPEIGKTTANNGKVDYSHPVVTLKESNGDR